MYKKKNHRLNNNKFVEDRYEFDLKKRERETDAYTIRKMIIITCICTYGPDQAA